MRRDLNEAIRNYGVQVIVLAALWIGFGITTPALTGQSGIYSVLLGFSLLGLVTLGLSAVMITGELDLSVAGMVAVSGAVAIKAASLGLVPAILVAMAACSLIGLAQGLIIAMLRINSLIVTIGTLISLGGVAFIICGGESISVSNIATIEPLFERWGVFSWDIIVALVVFIVLGAVLHFLRFGKEIYAIGGGRQQAIAAGVPPRRPIVTAFVISALCSGLAGALTSLKGASAQPTTNTTLLLQAVTAALIGGISLSGGRGTALNVAFGVAVLTLLSAGLSANGAQNYVVQLSTGAVLLAVVFLEFLFARLELMAVARRRSSAAVAADGSG
jgi:ribose/xylose/arabinose/galactoside ABC-type transport system permease subunit